MINLSCTYCRRAIAGSYIANDWGESFCADHLEEWPQCTFCGRLVPNNRASTRYAAHARCEHCAAVAIEDPALARGIAGDMVSWLVDEGLTLDRPVRFNARLVERHDLQSNDEERVNTLGMASTTFQADAPIRLEILLLQGMPSPLFEGVTVHELGHAWLACRQVTDLPRWANEGFCEWISHRWYRQQGTASANHYASNIEENDNPVYGGGYCRLRDLEGRVGFERIVHHLVTNRKLPP